MPDYNLKKFTDVGGRFENRISITKSYSFGFPTKFWEENVKGFKYAVLFYDAVKRVIAFKFTNDENESYKFSLIDYKNYGGGIAARSFFKANNLDPVKYKGRYAWKKENIEGVGEVYIIELGDKGNGHEEYPKTE